MTTQAERMLARLEATDLANPRIDRRRVELAWREHCRLLRLEPLPLRWVKDAEAALAALDSEEVGPASWWSAWKSAVSDALAELAGESVGDLWRQPEVVPRWSATRSRALLAAWRAAEEETGIWNWTGHGVAGWSAPEAAAQFVLGPGSPFGEAAGRRWLEIWRPCVDAFEAGHWLFAVRHDDALVVPRPTLHIAQERLHCETGPAVFWPDGARYYF